MSSAGVGSHDRSALEYIYMKPWRKSLVTREFLMTPVCEVELDQAASQFSAGHSIFSASGSGLSHPSYHFGKGSSQAGYNFPVHCPNGGLGSYREEAGAEGEAEDDDDE